MKLNIADEPESKSNPLSSRDGQAASRMLLGTMVSSSHEACTAIRSLAPPRRWELEQEAIASYRAVVLQMNTLLRSCTSPPDRKQRV